jgi:hypothetical protein
LRERLGVESEVFRCRQQEVGTQSKRLSARFHISYDIQEWPSGAEFRIAELRVELQKLSSFSAVASAIVQVEATFSLETTAFLPGLALRAAWRHLALPLGQILA